MRTSPSGLLASIICLDQFPRNMYRETPQSFAYDSAALDLAKRLRQLNWDQQLPAVYRVFAYMPYEHSEELAMQDIMVHLLDDLRKQVASSEREVFDGFYQFGIQHQKVIQRFGRFPHRNAILGRESSDEEKVFLSQPGSSF